MAVRSWLFVRRVGRVGHWSDVCRTCRVAATLLLFIALTSGTGFCSTTAGAARAQAKAVEAELQKAIDRAQAGFVFIGGGSGVCISADGYVFTNHHVVQRHTTWDVRIYGLKKPYVADVVGLDPVGDVALLKIRNAKGLPFAPLAAHGDLRIGQPVLALGDPYKLGDLEGPPSVSLGTLCGLHRYQNDPEAPTPTFFADALQTDAAVNPGSSGGPLFDLNGRLLGITGQIMSRFGGKANSGIAYAVPAEQLARFLPVLKRAQGSAVAHGTLPDGLKLEWEDAKPSKPGAVVASVKSSSAAQWAGFRVGDRVTKADGETVTSPHRLMGIVQSRPRGVFVSFEVQRNGKRIGLRFALP